MKDLITQKVDDFFLIPLKKKLYNKEFYIKQLWKVYLMLDMDMEEYFHRKLKNR
jgi:hypothetical protein